jgi:hypothetical protein
MRTRLAQRSLLQHRSLLAVFAAGLLLSWTSESFAYRPFDGTDAAVADVGESEVELQPAGAQWSRGQNLLIAPAVVYNYGVLKDWEAVLESQRICQRRQSPLNTFSGQARFRIRPVPASPPNLVFCCRTAMATADLAQPSMRSYRSGGTGEPFI